MRFWMFFSSTHSHIVDTTLPGRFTLCQKPVDVDFPTYLDLSTALARTTCALCLDAARRIQ